MAYTSTFFKAQKIKSAESSREVVPIVHELFKPQSVVDVGCGTGSWLSAFFDLGITDIVGVDGPWVNHDLLAIPLENFIEHDLTRPLRLDRKFDLAMSLEVAEHLPEEVADSFVDSLTNLAPIVMFSAAIPFQGGNHHSNEQWQDYWADLFQKRNYVPLDCVRPRIWENQKVAYFYRQNMLVYIHKDYLTQFPQLQQYTGRPVSLVHPEFLSSLGIGALLKLIPTALARTTKSRLRRLF